MGAKRHHYVPRFLIARFADPPSPRGTLLQLDRSTGRVLRTSPTNAAVIGRYYDFTTGGDEFPVDGAENLLGVVESAAAPLVQQLADPGSTLRDDERLTMALFAALLFLRVPAQREWLRLIDERAGRKLVKDIAEQPTVFRDAMRAIDEPTDPPEIEENRRQLLASLNGGGIEFEAPPERQITMMFELALDLAWDIAAMSWLVLRVPDSRRFVVGDSPMTMYDPRLIGPRGNALCSSPKAETILPLDPAFALCLRPYGNELGERMLTASEVVEINLRSYAWAQRWIFGFAQGDLTDLRTEAKRHRARVAKRRPRSPTIVLDAELVDGRRSLEVIRHIR